MSLSRSIRLPELVRVPVGLSAPHISSTSRLTCRRFRCQYLYFGTCKASKLDTCVGGWRRRDARDALRRSTEHQVTSSGQQVYVASGVSICTLVLVKQVNFTPGDGATHATHRRGVARAQQRPASIRPAAPSASVFVLLYFCTSKASTLHITCTVSLACPRSHTATYIQMDSTPM